MIERLKISTSATGSASDGEEYAPTTPRCGGGGSDKNATAIAAARTTTRKD